MVARKGYKLTEVGEIPEDWLIVFWDDAFSITSGQVDPKISPYCDMILVAPDHIESESGRILKKETAKCQNATSGKYVFYKNDIVYSKIRPNLKKVYCAKFDGICSADMYPLRSRKGFYHDFLFYILLGSNFSRFARSLSARSGIPKINRRELSSFIFAVPSTYVEQTAIATALSDTDALIEALELSIAKKRQIKLGTMQELLTGKRRLPGFKGKWKMRLIGEFTDCATGGTPSTFIPSYWDGEIPWMSSGELHLKQIYDVVGRITELGLSNSSTRIIPRSCVLIGLAGQGKTRGTVAMTQIELCTNQSIAAIFPHSSFVSEYLFHNLNARYDELRELSTSSAGRGGLNLNIIRGIEIPFPTKEEQAAIATVLSDMDDEIAALEAKLAKARQIKKGMMQELLTGRIRLI